MPNSLFPAQSSCSERNHVAKSFKIPGQFLIDFTSLQLKINFKILWFRASNINICSSSYFSIACRICYFNSKSYLFLYPTSIFWVTLVTILKTKVTIKCSFVWNKELLSLQQTSWLQVSKCVQKCFVNNYIFQTSNTLNRWRNVTCHEVTKPCC